MSRMTLITQQAMESSKILHKNTSFLSRKNTSRKMTAMKGLKSMNTVALNTIQDVTNSNLNQELAKKLKERLQRFIGLSLMLFSSHIIEVATQKPKSKFQNCLGATTSALRKFPFIIEPSMLEDNKPFIATQKMNSGASYGTLDSIEPTEYGSPKPNRTSIVHSGSGNNNDEFPNDSSFGSNLSNKKLDEPPNLNPQKNLAFLNSFTSKNTNALEMIQEEMEDRNSINDLRKFTDTTNRFHRKLETIRESVHLINSEEVGLELVKGLNLKSAKPSTFLTQNEIDTINRMNESSRRSDKNSNKDREEEKFDELSTKSEKMPENSPFSLKNQHQKPSFLLFPQQQKSPKIPHKPDSNKEIPIEREKPVYYSNIGKEKEKTPNHFPEGIMKDKGKHNEKVPLLKVQSLFNERNSKEESMKSEEEIQPKLIENSSIQQSKEMSKMLLRLKNKEKETQEQIETAKGSKFIIIFKNIYIIKLINFFF